ncbi:hypothetical protein GF345_01300 [Candidatus Woesearchaeota archaeon]|nr:hypothetical protein [Candidatus Woesearchaeota archaeon]
MLIHFVKFTFLVIIGVLEIIFINDPMLNLIAYMIFIVSTMLLISGLVMPKKRY